MLKHVFMGSPPIAATILKSLVENGQRPLAVVTQEAKPAGRGKALSPTAVAQYAARENIPLMETANVNSSETLEALKKLSPDVLCVAAFGQIFREPLLKLPKICCLNVHASLLPKYRGAAPIQRAIWAGDPITGVSIQQMVKALDAGDILVQKEIAILAEDTSETMLVKLAALGSDCLLESLRLLESGKYRFTPQDPAQVSFAPKIEREEALIDWTKPSPYIFNQVRALQPWPVAETWMGSDRLRVFRASLEPVTQSGAVPGTILSDGKTRLGVVCGDQRVLFLTEIQAENRKRLEIVEFLKGFRGLLPHASMIRN